MSANLMQAVVSNLLAQTEHPYPDMRTLAQALTNAGQLQTGTVTGTGASLDVDTAGNPRVVIIVNATDIGAGVKISGMAGAYALKVLDTPAVSYANAMITLDTGKFTIGSDADLNGSGDTIVWMALI
jgi:hypothetical protein